MLGKRHPVPLQLPAQFRGSLATGETLAIFGITPFSRTYTAAWWDKFGDPAAAHGGSELHVDPTTNIVFFSAGPYFITVDLHDFNPGGQRF
jgi:hypothetical protein